MNNVIVEIDNDGERLECIHNIQTMNDYEITMIAENVSAQSFYDKIKDQLLHHYAIYITSEEDIGGVDTTGIQPYMSFDGIIMNRNTQIMPEGLHEHYLIRKVGV